MLDVLVLGFKRLNVLLKHLPSSEYALQIIITDNQI